MFLFLLVVWNLNFIATDNSGGGREAKIALRFFRCEAAKQGAEEASLRATHGDYATGVGLQISPSPPNKNRNSNTKGLRFLRFYVILYLTLKNGRSL